MVYRVDFRRVFELSRAAELLLDHEGRVLAATTGYLEATDLSRTEVLGAAMQELPPYLAEPKLQALLHSALQAARTGPGASLRELRGSLPCRTGVRFTSASSEAVSDEGSPCVVILHRLEQASELERPAGASQTAQMAEQLRQYNDLLQSALEQAHAIAWRWDLRTNQILWFGNFAAFAGKEPKPALHELAMIHPDDRERFERAAREALEQDRTFHVEFRGPERDGKERWYAARGEAQRGEAPGLISGVTWDITDLHSAKTQQEVLEKRLKEAQKVESLGVLAAGIAHDFNNLLAAIVGNASLAKLVQANEQRVRTHLERIEVAAERAAGLCKQMLAYAGKADVAPQLTDLNRLVERTVEMLEPSIGKGVVLHTRLANDLPPVMADGAQIRQVIANLIVNASEAIGAQAGAILVETRLVQVTREYLARAFLATEIQAGTYVCIEVVDSGEGMTPETLARVFEPFFSTKFTGRGLGLAASLGILRSHGGTFEAESEFGKGSTFRLLLPSEIPPTSAAHS